MRVVQWDFQPGLPHGGLYQHGGVGDADQLRRAGRPGGVSGPVLDELPAAVLPRSVGAVTQAGEV